MQFTRIKRNKLDFRADEAYKTLRTNVGFLGNHIQVISITSVMPNEGKSTTAMELAISFAEVGKRVVLVDADFRKPSLQEKTECVAVKHGITDCLVGNCSIKETLFETDVQNLFMAFVGTIPPNPSELLSGDIFRKYIEALKGVADLVIIDTPPVGSVIDAAIISRVCDGVIIVIQQGAISSRFAVKVRDQLEQAGARILGCVLNKVKNKVVRDAYYREYYDQ